VSIAIGATFPEAHTIVQALPDGDLRRYIAKKMWHAYPYACAYLYDQTAPDSKHPVDPIPARTVEMAILFERASGDPVTFEAEGGVW